MVMKPSDVYTLATTQTALGGSMPPFNNHQQPAEPKFNRRSRTDTTFSTEQRMQQQSNTFVDETTSSAANKPSRATPQNLEHRDICV